MSVCLSVFSFSCMFEVKNCCMDLVEICVMTTLETIPTCTLLFPTFSNGAHINLYGSISSITTETLKAEAVKFLKTLISTILHIAITHNTTIRIFTIAKTHTSFSDYASFHNITWICPPKTQHKIVLIIITSAQHILVYAHYNHTHATEVFTYQKSHQILSS